MTTTMLAAALKNYRFASQQSAETWAAREEQRGQNVALYRNYADGIHRDFLTTEMRKMLRIRSARTGDSTHFTRNEQRAGGFEGEPFNDNYMPLVVNAVVDRLEVTSIEDTGDKAGKPAPITPPTPMSASGATSAAPMPIPAPEVETPKGAAAWAQDLLDRVRFDELQLTVHDAAVCDGESYLLIDWDNDEKEVRWTHEPAYDGEAGMLVLYPNVRERKPALAIKIWQITTDEGKEQGSYADKVRINVYHPDRIEYFIGSKDGTAFEEYQPVEQWVSKDGKPLGVPVIPFRNKARGYDQHGRSELDDAIPLQDALNRTLTSMIMASELTAFQMRVAKGFVPPAETSPGMWVVIDAADPDLLKSIDAYVLEQAELVPYIDMMRHLKSEIGAITQTPMMDAGDTMSRVYGEALKQRDTGLLGKAKRAQISFGNSWEDCLAFSHKIETAFTVEAKPPQFKAWRCRWRDAEMRNEQTLVDTAVKMLPIIGDEEFLKMMSPVTGHTESDIARILKNTANQRAARMLEMTGQGAGGNPGFDNFNGFGSNGGGATRPAMAMGA